MSSLRMASHWNHTPCESCMEQHGLTKPSRSRRAPGPCCFCGGERPDELRGRAPAGVSCNGMQEQPPDPVEGWTQALDEAEEKPVEVPVELKADRKLPGRKSRRVVQAVRGRSKANRIKGKVQPRVKEPAPKPEPVKQAAVGDPDWLKEKTPAPKPTPVKGKNPKENISPEKADEMQKKQEYAARLVKFAKESIMGRSERGKNEEFSFVTVKIKPDYRFGEAGAHIHRGEGWWLGRPAGTTHLPRRGLLIIDRETHRSVAMTMRWRCGTTAIFGKLTKKANHKVCPKCIKSEESGMEQAAKKANKEKQA